MTLKKFDTLYKRTTKGAVQIWYMEQDGNRHRATSGQIDGKHVTSEWTECQGKNIGKANETSPEEQAALEIEAKYTKQRAQGKYHDTPDEIDNSKYFAPMLAEKYADRLPSKKDFDSGIVYSQPKLDGMRCIARADGLWTRKGKPIPVAPHISELLKPIFEKIPDAIIDGELYNHDLKSEFEELMSIAKQTKPTADDIEKSIKYLQFHVYDFYTPQAKQFVFFDRYTALVYAVGSLKTDVIKPVATSVCTSQEQLDNLYDYYLEEGYEGQMVRMNNTPYENKRSTQLLKRKTFVDAEFPIARIEAGKGNRADWAARVVCMLADGKTEFGAGINGNAKFCKQLLIDKDKYEGKGEATIKYQRFTADNIPLFGKAIAFYEGKRDV